MNKSNRKFYIIVEKVVTNILKREALTIRTQSSKDINKSLEGKNIYSVKEISKEKYKMYFENNHKWVTGQLIVKGA